jgi:hypothetical protein
VLQSGGGGSSNSEQHFGAERRQFLCKHLNAIQVTRRPSGLNLKVATLYPAERIETFAKCYVIDFALRIILCEKAQNPEAMKAISLLGMEGDRPNHRSARDNRDELAPSHRLLQKGPTALAHWRQKFGPKSAPKAIFMGTRSKSPYGHYPLDA